MYSSNRKCLEIPMKGEKGNQMLETIKGQVAHRRKSEEGFTLIELLVVIVILAILAAIVVFAVGGIGGKGQTEACNTDLKTIQTAQEAFFANSSPHAYAADLNTLKTQGFLTNDDPTKALHSTTATGVGNTGYTIDPIGTKCTDNYTSTPN